MTAQLNHTIVYASDPTKSAHFLAQILGRPAPVRFGHFEVVELDNGVRRCRPHEINHNDGGRGVYFPDPDDHFLEVITRPYGSIAR